MKFLLLIVGAVALAGYLDFLPAPVAFTISVVAVAAFLFIVSLAVPMRKQRQRWFPVAILGVFFAASLAASAHAATIDLGIIAANGLADFVAAVFAALLSLAVGWVLYVVKNKFNIDIEATNRDALKAFVERQARSLVADGATKLSGVKIEVSNNALAAAANAGLSAVPDALKYFGLTPEKVSDMIVDALPQVPSVAQAQAVALDVANPSTPSKAAD